MAGPSVLRRSGRFSVKLVLSYVLDWIVIVLFALVGLGISKVSPNKRPFYLADPTLNFPFKGESGTVSSRMLFIASLVGPAIIIGGVCLVFVPGPTPFKSLFSLRAWRRRVWELNTGLLGLALSLALSVLVTDGMKNLLGKPRPDMISRCQPDLEKINEHIVGGLGRAVEGAPLLVSAAICRRKDGELDDGFRSFPSGHASLSFAGLIYLSLFLCSKFAVAIPFLAPQLSKRRSLLTAAFPSRALDHSKLTPPHQNSYAPSISLLLPSSSPSAPAEKSHIPVRNQAAAPPTYLLVLILIPLGAAIFIASSRYSDYRHHGFDIISGVVLGLLTAWFAFRWYHLPIRRGAGWAWGPRSSERAFWVGVGVPGYAGSGDEGVTSARELPRGGDVESGLSSRGTDLSGGNYHGTGPGERSTEPTEDIELEQYPERWSGGSQQPLRV
ncbi:MAG: hypothetical protein M1817_002546 [Caeruleum heppii]|nr:MAG: hypothetical protein M1817_002546 [Caeruleum heppii]